MSKKVSVYLGSSYFCKDEYKDLAHEVGYKLAKAGHTIVYGGAAVGTMGALADGAQQAGGTVIGVFPKGFLGTRDVRAKGIEVFREGLAEMIIAEDFAERKQVMEDLGDCAVVLPGSFGTLDELFTYACNHSIDKNNKPIYILNHKGYYNAINTLIEEMDRAGFLKDLMRGVITLYDTADELIAALD